MADAWTYKVRPGGLMRCDLLSLDDAMVKRVEEGLGPPEEGDRVKCDYCSTRMIFRVGWWEWDRVVEGPGGRG